MKQNIKVSIIALALLAMGCKTKAVSQDSQSKPMPQLAEEMLDLNQKIPQNPKLKKGVLDNGMMYYLYSTDVTKNVADFYIIQNVGSVLENEDQRGLAHFLEHMAFNGTENFPDKTMLSQLQEHGLVFGRDINAYTSFDETVYNVNRIPTTEKMTDVGLQILHDWSNFLLLTDKEIDAERGVIKEEWRTSQNGNMRILDQKIGADFGFSKYAKRSPIGLMSIVENFDYKALRDFYHDWYRTDLQAIAVVGDIDIAEMEAKIKSKFSKIPAVSDAPERYDIEIEDNDELVFASAMDKEVPLADIAFKIRHPKTLRGTTVEDLKIELVTNIVTDILTERFAELSQDPSVPTLGFDIRYSPFARLHESFDIAFQPKINRQQEAFTLAMNELNRAVKFGFTNSEIKRAIANALNRFEVEAKGLEDLPSFIIVEDIKGDYLEKKPMADPVKRFDLAQTIFENLKPEEVHDRLKELYTKKNRTVLTTAVQGNDNLTETQAKSIIAAAENNTELKPYEEDGDDASLMAGVALESGTIVNEEKNEALGFTTYTLSNGAKVHYKYVDKSKNDLSINLVSHGGSSLVETENLPAALVLPNYLQDAGLGNYSSSELRRITSGKTAMVRPSIDDTSESIFGYATPKDFETLLQLVHLHFTKPRFEQQDYESFLQNIGTFVASKDENLQAKMYDSITVALYGKNHPIRRIIDKDFVSDIALDNIKNVYKSRFSNIADFEFFVAGDITAEQVKPLLEKFIAGIPASEKREQWKDNTVAWKKEKIKKEIFMPMENPKSTVNINIEKEMPYSLKDKFLTNTLGKLLQLRYTATLREEEGGTYGASAGADLSEKPRSMATLGVNFDCNPDLTDKLVRIVYEEMDKMKNGLIDEEDLEKTKKELLKERKDFKNSMEYDMQAMQNYVVEGYNMELPENFEQIIKGINKDQIQDIAKRILTDNRSYEIVFKPQQ